MESYLKKTACIFSLYIKAIKSSVLSKESRVLIRRTLSAERMAAIAEAERIDLTDDMKRSDQLADSLRHIVAQARAGGFAVSGETFYVEHKRMLFKWKPGETEWTNTGLIDLGKQPVGDLPNEFKAAASGKLSMSVNGMANCFNRLMRAAVGEILPQAYRFTLRVSTRYALSGQQFMSQQTLAFYLHKPGSTGVSLPMERGRGS